MREHPEEDTAHLAASDAELDGRNPRGAVRLVEAEGRMIAWVLSRGDDIVPLIDARTRERLAVALVAWQTELEPDALAAIGGRPGRGGDR